MPVRSRSSAAIFRHDTPWFRLFDNQFNPEAPHFTDGGLLLAMDAGVPDVNVYFFQGDYVDLTECDTACIETPISFNVTAVPEPATVLSMLAGLGLVGFQLRRRRALGSKVV